MNIALIPVVAPFIICGVNAIEMPRLNGPTSQTAKKFFDNTAGEAGKTLGKEIGKGMGQFLGSIFTILAVNTLGNRYGDAVLTKIEKSIINAREWWYKEIDACKDIGLVKFKELINSNSDFAGDCAIECSKSDSFGCKGLGEYAFKRLLEVNVDKSIEFYKTCVGTSTDQCQWIGLDSFEKISEKNAEKAENLMVHCAKKIETGCIELGLPAIKMIAGKGEGLTIAVECTKIDSPQCKDIISGIYEAGFEASQIATIRSLCQHTKMPHCENLISKK